MTFTAPTQEIAFTLKHITGLKHIISQELFEDLDEELVDAILEEAGKFATEEIAPINQLGDEQGAQLSEKEVTLPAQWSKVYNAWTEAGWGSLPGPKEYGGQGLPVMLAMACTEMSNAASMAFGINSVLTQAAVHAIKLYGTDEQKSLYLPKLVTGEWTGTMHLTEPQAGSDLGHIKAKAVPQGDGIYHLTGTKIFITYGEHQLTENIIHMVLARTPDAPEGTKGISLFAVPKFQVNQDGSLGPRNDVVCAKLEHKLGIHASPTCVMNFGDNEGAIGYLIGEENKGLNAMFVMMNEARLAVGIQGVGIAERAYQQALNYARERKQGRTPETAKGDMALIIEHPDIRKSLLSMKAKTSAARAICYMTAYQIDLAQKAKEQETREKALALASLLTPLAKGYSTDIGVEVSSEGVQIHGGMGYIEETGAAQHFRDARIAPIYEGTNGIQALDLVTRKLPLNDGTTVKSHFEDLKQTVATMRETNQDIKIKMADKLERAVLSAEETSLWMLEQLKENPQQALAGATAFARVFAIATGAAYLAKGISDISDYEADKVKKQAVISTKYYIEHICGEIEGLKLSVMEGANSILSVKSDDFI